VVASKKQRQTRHGRNIPNYEPKNIRKESKSSTLYLTPLMTEAAESSSSNSDLGDLEGSMNKNAISQYVRDSSSSHESTPCSAIHTLTPNTTPNKPIINQVQGNVTEEELSFTG